MVNELPLYPEPPEAAVELGEALAVTSACDRCVLSKRAKPRTVCMSADADLWTGKGGLLVVGDYPSRSDDATERPFTADVGALARQLVKDSSWGGNVVYDNAIRCYPGLKGVTPANIKDCRPYLAQTIQEMKPERIIAMGASAAYGLMGRSLPPISTRKAYGFLSDGTPVFYVLSPLVAIRNKFIRRWLEEDMRWALEVKTPRPRWDGVARVVRTPEDLEYALDDLYDADWVAYDTETAGVMWNPDFRILSVALTPAGSKDGWVWDDVSLADPVLLAELKRLLADPKLRKFGQNLKYDLHAVRLGLGVTIPEPAVWGDTRLMRKLLEPEAAADLATMAELVGMGGHKGEAEDYRDEGIKEARSLINASAAAKAAKDAGRQEDPKEEKKRLKAIEKADTLVAEASPAVKDVARAILRGAEPKSYAYTCIPRDVLSRYNVMDTVSTAYLGQHLERELKREPYINETWERVMRPASWAFAEIENWGVQADPDAIRLFGDNLRADAGEVRQRIRQYKDFDLDSPKQVGAYLFDELKLVPSKFSEKTGDASTDAEVLSGLKGQHPVVDLMLEYRGFSTLFKYADGSDGKGGLLKHVRADGRIHPSFNLDGARTGRLSASDPNTQNIPRPETPYGKMARNCFVSRPGFTLLEADYSQLELRVAAMVSGDTVMADIFRSGVDYHARTAEMIAGVAWGVKDWNALAPEAKKKYRSASKAVNFGLAYGKTDPSLAHDIGCTVAQARKIREEILGNLHVFDAWSKRSIAEARRTGEVWTWWDGKPARRRPLYQIGSPEEGKRRNAENGAINTPIQGTASDFCLASILELVRWIKEEGLEDLVRLVLTVHDSIMLEVADHMVEEVAYNVHRIMTGWPTAGVPLVADFKTGNAWGSCEDKHWDWLAA